jgi:ferredoxin-thioredoxin reductase catalytic subunit
MNQENVVNHTPYMGIGFEYVTVAYDFYNKYNRKVGFIIHSDYSNTNKKHGTLTSRRFSHSKEGNRCPHKHVTKEKTTATKIGCQARIVI